MFVTFSLVSKWKKTKAWWSGGDGGVGWGGAGVRFLSYTFLICLRWNNVCSNTVFHLSKPLHAKQMLFSNAKTDKQASASKKRRYKITSDYRGYMHSDGQLYSFFYTFQ